MAKFGNKKIKIAPHISTIFSLLPAIQFYIEKESFEDATVFMLSLKLFNLECLVAIRTKRNTNYATH